MVGRFSEDFVDSRRRLLEKFLNRVAVHDLLRESEVFKQFLEASEETLARERELDRTGSQPGTALKLTEKIGERVGGLTADRTPDLQ